MEPIRENRKDEEFTDFVHASRPQLRRTAYLLCGEIHDADDLVQTALLAVYRSWSSISERQNCYPYAHRVLVNAFISDRRHARWQREAPWASPPHRPLPDGALDRIHDRDLLLRALGRLGPRQRAVLVLRMCEDLSVAQTARILDCDQATVRSQTSRAL